MIVGGLWEVLERGFYGLYDKGFAMWYIVI